MTRSFAALAIALLACVSPAHAQQDYPNHTIAMVVPFPPGGNGTTIVTVCVG